MTDNRAPLRETMFDKAGQLTLPWRKYFSVPIEDSVSTRITPTNSPYTVLKTDFALFVDTDSGAVTVNLLAGTEGMHYKIINCGSSGNDVTVDPNGSEEISGGGAGVATVLTDGDKINIHYEKTEGWW